MVKYYKIRDKGNPKAYGDVVIIEDGKLEMFAGRGNPSRVNCSLDDDGNLIVEKPYFSSEISHDEALELREKHDNWNLLRGWVGTDSTPNNILYSTPGLRHLSR